MRAIIQRSLHSSVTVNKKVIGEINSGLVIFVGFTSSDTPQIVDKVINKIINLRVFSDENDKINISLFETKGEILSISQFTLYANISKGRRPSFEEAMKPNHAIKLYNYFNEKLEKTKIKVSKGEFGADMKVNIINDGPVTIFIDSEYL